MPLYDFRCSACHVVWEGLARWNEIVQCPCGEVADRLISPPAVIPEMAPYYDDGLGVRVESRSHRKAVMKAKNLVECDPGNIRPHGAKGTIFSFAGRATESVPPSGGYAKGRR